MSEETRAARRGPEIANCLHIVSVMDYLSETTPFADLSIADICKASDISRSTFYRLFDDKFDAVNWFIYEVSRLGHTQTGRTLSWHDASFTTLSGFLIARNLLVSASKAAGYESTGPQKPFPSPSVASRLCSTNARNRRCEAGDSVFGQVPPSQTPFVRCIVSGCVYAQLIPCLRGGWNV